MKTQEAPPTEIKETGCCPIFKPEPWENKELEWEDKLFIKDHVKSVLHIPLNFGDVIVRNMKKIENDKQRVLDDLILSDENSLWGSDLYFSVDSEVPDAENVKLSGIFYTKVFEGPYRDIGKWTKEMKAYLEGEGKKAEKIFYWYTTCPKCAKAYGKNYVVLFAKVD